MTLLQSGIKVGITAIVVVIVAELSKRDAPAAALLASIPLTSVLAMLWMHQGGAEATEVAAFATEVLWLVLPSCALFVALPMLVQRGWDLVPALGVGLVVTAMAYALVLLLRARMVGDGVVV
jgi:hypothetical protein